MNSKVKTDASQNCYDYPQYWDLAFRSETRLEADFIEQACRRYAIGPATRLLEPACGGGRLVVEMAARSYEMVGFDISEPAIRYLQRRLRRRGLVAEVFVDDMTDFALDQPVDAAFNTFNTFRHLTTEDAARRHLEAVARNVRAGGVYILGLHLLPPDADMDCGERWTTRHGKTQVTLSLKVLESSRRRRIEVIRFWLRVRSGKKDLRLRTDYRLRIYTADQFRSLLASTPQWELCDVFDFWYDIEDPLELNDELGDSVFVLRKLAD